MTSYVYDPTRYLTTTKRVLKDYVTDKLVADPTIGDVVDVQMSFPDTRDWTLKSPLERSVVHFELDDDPEVRLGFGVPQAQEDGDDPDTVVLSEPALHMLNFDVGIWTSPQSGGETKRMQIREALYSIFGPAGARQDITQATDGIVVVSYDGGSDVLDRVNDLPVYRTTQIVLVVKVFSKHTNPAPVGVITTFDQAEKLSIEEDDGSLEELRTVEDPWS